jgi:hypothetical protein
MAKYFQKVEGLREVSHNSSIWCLFRSYWSWDLIGRKRREVWTRNCCWMSTGHCTGHWTRLTSASGQYWMKEQVQSVHLMMNSVLGVSGVWLATLHQRVWSVQDGKQWMHQTLSCVQSVDIRRVQSRQEHPWTSLFRTRHLAVASGDEHLCIRSR